MGYVTIRFKFQVTKTYEIETTGYGRDQAFQYAQESADTTWYQDRAETDVDILEEEIIKED